MSNTLQNAANDQEAARLITAETMTKVEPEAFPTEAAVYNAARTVPGFPVVRLGRRVLIDLAGWQEFKRRGGQALPGGWRKEPRDAA